MKRTQISRIRTPSDFGRLLKSGPYTFPGCYPIYFVCSDGEALSFADALENAALICSAIRDGDTTGWRIVGAEINWENGDLYSAHSGKKIEAAYV